MPLRIGVDSRNIWQGDVGGHAVRLRGDTPCTRGDVVPSSNWGRDLNSMALKVVKPSESSNLSIPRENLGTGPSSSSRSTCSASVLLC
jgi:hypothetical protein